MTLENLAAIHTAITVAKRTVAFAPLEVAKSSHNEISVVTLVIISIFFSY
jgi:hypothetical protein